MTPTSKNLQDSRSMFERAAINLSHAAGERVCHLIAQLFSHTSQSILIRGPMKGEDSQNRKVFGSEAEGGYEGEWAKLKDLVRSTILARDTTAFETVVTQFARVKDSPKALNDEIARLYNLPHFKDYLFRSISPGDRAMLLSGQWEVMPNCFKQKTGLEDGYTDASVVLQNTSRHSVGGAGQAKVPNRAANRANDARWAFTVRTEIQINVPNMIYGKQEKDEFLKMIPAPLGERYLAEISQQTRILGGLGHLFYEVSRKNVLKEITQKLSKRYYEYIRMPSPGSPLYSSLCADLAQYIDTHRRLIKTTIGGEHEHELPGDKPPKNTLTEITLGFTGGKAASKWGAVNAGSGFRSTG